MKSPLFRKITQDEGITSQELLGIFSLSGETVLLEFVNTWEVHNGLEEDMWRGKEYNNTRGNLWELNSQNQDVDRIE